MLQQQSTLTGSTAQYVTLSAYHFYALCRNIPYWYVFLEKIIITGMKFRNKFKFQYGIPAYIYIYINLEKCCNMRMQSLRSLM
jgi:hypothetical protein